MTAHHLYVNETAPCVGLTHSLDTDIHLDCLLVVPTAENCISLCCSLQNTLILLAVFEAD